MPQRRLKYLNLLLYPLLLLGLPLAGVMINGGAIAPYLQFPPQTEYVAQQPFSWAVFVGMALFIAGAVFPFFRSWWRYFREAGSKLKGEGATFTGAAKPFPWWGWLGIVLGILIWILAWTRFDWFSPFQRYTFSPLWLCYIVVMNALLYKKRGWSFLTHQTGYFLALFVVSAIFWWFFEYLNRFVGNWYYLEVNTLSAWAYFWEATLPFATVLPAVLSTQHFLYSFPAFRKPFSFNYKLHWIGKKTIWLAIGIIASAGLLAIPIYPHFLFPLLWVAPLILWVTLQVFRGYINPLLSELKKGRWQLVWSSAMAALICGFFWEMWNFYSLSKWIYSIPYVEAFYIFEMPILGYAGYLPFGLECVVIGESLARLWGIKLFDVAGKR